MDQPEHLKVLDASLIESFKREWEQVKIDLPKLKAKQSLALARRNTLANANACLIRIHEDILEEFKPQGRQSRLDLD